MKRFIRYLYEYEQGKRIRNVGFVKVEAGDEETNVNIQAKGFHNRNERKLVLYLFYEENGKMIGVRQAEFELTTPVLSESLSYNRDTPGILDSYSKINGIILEAESGRQIAATWDDRPVDVSRREEVSPKSLHLVERPVCESDIQKHESAMPVCEEENDERNAQRNEEIHPEAEMGGHEKEEAWHEVQEIEVYAQPEQRTDTKIVRKATKIRRQDLAKLSRCEWKLANNQFLIYGYNNYHHLLMIEEGNILKIGVPGIYHIKEAQAAKSFGFEEFLSVEELMVPLGAEERHADEPFGYWCRMVRKRCGVNKPDYYTNGKDKHKETTDVNYR